MAWWYCEYSRDDDLGRLEKEARANKNGLWGDPHPVPPWEWRHLSRNRSDTSAVDQLTTDKSKAAQTADEEQTVYVTPTGHKYHRARCRYFQRSKVPVKHQGCRRSRVYSLETLRFLSRTNGDMLEALIS